MSDTTITETDCEGLHNGCVCRVCMDAPRDAGGGIYDNTAVVVDAQLLADALRFARRARTREGVVPAQQEGYALNHLEDDLGRYNGRHGAAFSPAGLSEALTHQYGDGDNEMAPVLCVPNDGAGPEYHVAEVTHRGDQVVLELRPVDPF